MAHSHIALPALSLTIRARARGHSTRPAAARAQVGGGRDFPGSSAEPRRPRVDVGPGRPDRRRIVVTTPLRRSGLDQLDRNVQPSPCQAHEPTAVDRLDAFRLGSSRLRSPSTASRCTTRSTTSATARRSLDLHRTFHAQTTRGEVAPSCRGGLPPSAWMARPRDMAVVAATWPCGHPASPGDGRHGGQPSNRDDVCVRCGSSLSIGTNHRDPRRSWHPPREMLPQTSNSSRARAQT